ncbi:MAG TPA: alpha/beta fold hydrolase [Acidisphaera sp.]|nr:alpha/beta fold hydrolase [Acidisphaera sp.]
MPDGVDDDPVKTAADVMDRAFRTRIVASVTLGLSPAEVIESWVDWGLHLWASPGRQMWLAWKAARKGLRFGEFVQQCLMQGGHADPVIDPLPGDRRFLDPAWQNWPFNVYYQNFLLWQQLTHNAVTGVHGVEPGHERQIAFLARQMLDTVAPSNFAATNPVVIQRTIAEHGANLVRGFGYLMEDISRGVMHPNGKANPQVGHEVAVTPGKVVFRNRLIELIQYAPTTDRVAPEPLLIVPAWIMKYYILDLSPHNSMVAYLVDRGFTVFMISWRNPGAEDRDLGMEDYLDLGVMAAIDAVRTITGRDTLHAAGYCLGGTLLSIAAAAMARDGDRRLRSVSLFAAQQDFTEAGELTLFTTESQISLIDDLMFEQGYLDARQMAGAFRMLRSNDLVYSQAVEDYLLGQREKQTDLMAWNADATRMPARMHSEYLHRLFLENDLAEGRYQARGKTVAIGDIHVPIFAVGTTTDHVAPWRSVHKIHLLTDAEVTFVLTAGGHNAGIVSEPGHRGRHFQMTTRPANGLYVAPDEWRATAPEVPGSWWLAWAEWLLSRSGGPVAPPPIGRPEAGLPPLADAPGEYVLQA